MNYIDCDHIYNALDNCQAHTHSSQNEIENAINAVIDAANSVAKTYFDQFLHLQQKNPGVGSRLPSVRARKGVTGITLEIRWVRTYIGPEGRIRHTFSKGSGFAYNTEKLIKGSPDWERELVVEAEAQFSSLRLLYSQLSKCRQDIQRLVAIKKRIEHAMSDSFAA